MRQIAILTFCCFVLASCSEVKTTSNDNAQTNVNETISIRATTSPTTEVVSPLKPVVTKVKLNSRQKKNLNESLPPNVREVLEKAEKFEILAEVREKDEYDGEGTTLEPNRIVRITNENDKKEILEVYYSDAATNEPPASCYIPRHKLRAVYDGKTVEVEICFQCARFYVESPFGKSFGTIVRENRKSEDLFSRIIQNQSVELKQ